MRESRSDDHSRRPDLEARDDLRTQRILSFRASVRILARALCELAETGSVPDELMERVREARRG